MKELDLFLLGLTVKARHHVVEKCFGKLHAVSFEIDSRVSILHTLLLQLPLFGLELAD